MKHLTIILGCIVGLAVVLGVAVSAQERSALNHDGRWPVGQKTIDLPGDDDDEGCDGPTSDDESDDTPDCFISKAVVDASEPPTLTLEGQFCDEPAVFVGAEGGVLHQLFVVGSGDSFIQADLSPWNDPATRIVVVDCPCGDCAMDVTIGAQGPTGPPGPTGPAGEIPAGVGSLQVVVSSAIQTTPAGNMICLSAECPPGRLVTGGGFSTFSYGAFEPQPGFEVASTGPRVPSEDFWFPFGALPTGPWPASHKWTVCGTGSSGLGLIVYAVCVGGPPATCGDGRINPPEECETDQDCQLFGDWARCVDCACEWCGDGVVTPPEMCEVDDHCWLGDCVDCMCEDDPWDDFPGDGD
jgi:hypothetical protein